MQHSQGRTAEELLLVGLAPLLLQTLSLFENAREELEKQNTLCSVLGFGKGHSGRGGCV